MRIKIVLESLNTEKVKLPLHYNYLIQSFIYNHIDKELAEFLHNKGFGYEKRKFKMFVFSRVFSNKFKIVDEEIIFDKEIYFFISSPINEFLTQFAQNLFKTCEFTFGENDLILKGIHILGIPEIRNKEKIKMISPLTIYSTLFKKDKKKTYYYSPFEREFKILIEENLRKKYQAFYKKTFNFNFKIRPINVNKNNEKIINYKGTIIKGWLGTYEVESEPEIIKFAFDTGLGSKNSQGFGM
ncbi:MAG: CRISPR-associated endoribonuclease Cas6, partial [bacterium]|nr:CRISPR-associated endoribonuclease Cas6 [bacterium]MDW8163783.1 CRISPR-associated endoribonuclease Cas6 [Candidatus Omnitrophota bacterium]